MVGRELEEVRELTGGESILLVGRVVLVGNVDVNIYSSGGLGGRVRYLLVKPIMSRRMK